MDVLDVMAVASRWGCECGDECYDPLYDLDDDRDIDVVDIMLVASRWGCACGDACYSDAAVSSAALSDSGSGAGREMVRVRPSTSAVEAGEVFTISVQVQEAADLGSFQFTLGFDAATVQVENVALGDFLGSTGPTAVPLGPQIDNTAGTVVFGGFTFGVQPGPDGAGLLATVTMTAQGIGISPLALAEVQVTDTLGRVQEVAREDARVMVGVWRRAYLPLLAVR